MSELAHRAKRMLRPLVPDSVMARYRRHQHSRGIRTNVDLYVEDPRLARSFLSFTPDTYRVVSAPPPSRRAGDPDGDLVWVGEPSQGIDRYLGHHGSEAVAAATTGRPSMRSMRIVEPRLDVGGIVTTRPIIDGLGIDQGTDPNTAFRIMATAGIRMGVVPDVRRDFSAAMPPIDGDVVVVLAAVPVHDIGGGSRAAQLAFELLRRGYRVVYVDAYPSSEAIDLGLRYPHPGLWQIRLPDFDAAELVTATAPGLAIVEAPIGDFIEPLSVLRDAGWGVVYDVIDDWSDEALGGMWYAPVFEQAIVDLADAYTASAPDLVDRIAAFGHEAVLVPNAVNVDVFGAPTADPPPDLPDGPLLGYHGSLYGNWFDWEALEAVATSHPDHTVVVIGDARAIPTGLPGNVRFLGLKPQSALPAYLRRFDVGLVPFTVTPVTHAVSPLKVYEYLACGVPVAAPPLRALEGLTGVHVSPDLVAAVDAALAAERPDPSAALDQHSWGARVAALMGAAGRPIRASDGPPVPIVTRPPARYAKQDRWIR